jgi:antitoxin component YwqK of YwqJK toxin-antitoxin module
MRTVLCFSVFFCGLAIGLGRVRGGDSIELRSGTVVKTAQFEVHPVWRECFPSDQPFFAEKYSSGHLKGISVREEDKLNGVSATLHENGNLKSFASYPHGVRDGDFRLWDEDRTLLLVSQYREGMKHGVTCLFQNGEPWYIQEWQQNVLKSETILVRKETQFVAAEDSSQSALARTRLASAEEKFKRDEVEAKNRLKKWVAEETKKARLETQKVLAPVDDAEKKRNKQIVRKQAAEAGRTNADVVRGAHQMRNPVDRTIREEAKAVARGQVREANAAGGAIRMAQQNLKETEKEAKQELNKLEAAAKAKFKKLYEFAMTELEKSLD